MTALALKPCRQGALDELCGLYALINASRLIASRLVNPSPIKYEECVSIFALALSWLSEREDFRHTLYKGLYAPDLRSLHEGCFQKKWKTFTLDQPWEENDPPNDKDFWAWMREASQGNQCLIIPIESDDKKIDHWSVVREITEKKIFLFDSYYPGLNPSRRNIGFPKKRNLKRKKYVIWAKEVLLLKNNK